MKPCESLAHCRQHVKDCDPEGTYLDGKVMLQKHVCKLCGRVWAEVYVETGIVVDLTTEQHVTVISDIDLRPFHEKTEIAKGLLLMLENINGLKVSDRDEREEEL